MTKGYVFAAGVLASLLLAAPTFAAGASGPSLTVEATAYGPSLQDNYPYGPVDFYGRPLVAGDVAVDPSVIPLRSCLYITGYSSPNLPAGGYIGEADDEGGAIKGTHVDLFLNTSPAQVSNFGIQHIQVTVLGPATNPRAAGTAACQGYSLPAGSRPSGATNAGHTATNAGSQTDANTAGNTAASPPGSSTGNTAGRAGASAATTAATTPSAAPSNPQAAGCCPQGNERQEGRDDD